MIAHARAHLAGYKAPKRVLLVGALPRNAMEKMQQTLLRRRLADNGATADRAPPDERGNAAPAGDRRHFGGNR